MSVLPFSDQLKPLQSPLRKQNITVLQINLGKRCNLTCQHCHVEASPQRTEELSPEICQQLIQVIASFPQLQVVDLTGGAPEMFYGFKPLVEAATQYQKQVIVRSNLTIYFEPGFEEIPAYCAHHRVRIVASLPCYLEDNVDKMRGQGVYQKSIQALQWLNRLGYGQDPQLILDLVYNPPVPRSKNFSLPPAQKALEQDYKQFLQEQFQIQFNQLLTLANLPIGRTRFQLEHQGLYQPYVQFLADHFNAQTVSNLMCLNQLSVDYQGNLYDCDFNQMENLPATCQDDQRLTVQDLLTAQDLDLIAHVKTANYCYGCTAGSGSSCGGALV